MRSRQQRAEVNLPAIYFMGSAQGLGRVRNLSQNGLFLLGSLLPKEGEHVVIKLTTPSGREITVEGTIRWVTHADAKSAPQGFGVELSSYGDDYRVVVEAFLRTQHASCAGDLLKTSEFVAPRARKRGVTGLRETACHLPGRRD